ncbi:hypothetical protein JW930_05280 [Candidatus Woesearchaeota archaeon]|nr:hypothetical protein [Candidatus Woesearchaeota archaeon]
MSTQKSVLDTISPRLITPSDVSVYTPTGEMRLKYYVLEPEDAIQNNRTGPGCYLFYNGMQVPILGVPGIPSTFGQDYYPYLVPVAHRELTQVLPYVVVAAPVRPKEELSHATLESFCSRAIPFYKPRTWVQAVAGLNPNLLYVNGVSAFGFEAVDSTFIEQFTSLFSIGDWPGEFIDLIMLLLAASDFKFETGSTGVSILSSHMFNYEEPNHAGQVLEPSPYLDLPTPRLVEFSNSQMAIADAAPKRVGPCIRTVIPGYRDTSDASNTWYREEVLVPGLYLTRTPLCFNAEERSTPLFVFISNKVNAGVIGGEVPLQQQDLDILVQKTLAHRGLTAVEKGLLTLYLGNLYVASGTNVKALKYRRSREAEQKTAEAMDKYATQLRGMFKNGTIPLGEKALGYFVDTFFVDVPLDDELRAELLYTFPVLLAQEACLLHLQGYYDKKKSELLPKAGTPDPQISSKLHEALALSGIGSSTAILRQISRLEKLVTELEEYRHSGSGVPVSQPLLERYSSSDLGKLNPSRPISDQLVELGIGESKLRFPNIFAQA